MIEGFQKANPDVAVDYEDMLTGEIYDRIVKETDAGEKTADFAFSSAMDLQVKLSNDGYAQRSDLAMSGRWPAWANWRNTAYALTFEPAVFVYHKPSFKGRKPPETRAEFVAYLKEMGDGVFGRIGTYDIERSGVGFLFMARDQEQFGDIWSVIQAMGQAGVKLYSTSQAILERVADGRFTIGYNILGSYAADWAARHPMSASCCRRTIPLSCRASGWCRRPPHGRISGGATSISSCRARGSRRWPRNCRSPPSAQMLPATTRPSPCRRCSAPS